MTRFIQQDNSVQGPKEKKEKPREMAKPGSYTYEDLTGPGVKKIISPNGGKR